MRNLFEGIRPIVHKNGKVLFLDQTALPAETRWVEIDSVDSCRDAIKGLVVRGAPAIGIHGQEIVKDGMTVLTHCNAGALATGRYGTALAPIYVAKERGIDVKVFVDETRPLLQGSRLTAYELLTCCPCKPPGRSCGWSTRTRCRTTP
jgi:methylthioribose-1-phosphate isomerase